MTARPCTIKGVFYSSIKEAADAVGFTVPGVIHRLQSVAYTDWTYIG